MNKYNVLLITPCLDIGGEELSTIAVAEELIKKGHEVYYMSSGGPLLNRLSDKCINYLKGDVDGRSIFAIVKGAFSIRKALEKYNIDIIHASEPRLAIMGYCANMLSLSKKPKIIWHDRGTLHHFLSAKLFNFMSDFVITNSHYERNRLLKNGLLVSKVHTVHNSMYLSVLNKKDPSDIFEKYNIELNNGPIVGITSRLINRKGHIYFLQAIPQILKYFNKVKFIVVGGGILKEKLEIFTEKLGIKNNVSFVGFREDLEKIYPFLDILVVPSLYEPLGNVSLEAMAFGKPVVASDTGGIPEVVQNGVTGILVPPKDYEKIAEAIIFLLNNPDVAKKMGEAGEKRVKEYFTIDRVGNELEKIYHNVMEN